MSLLSSARSFPLRCTAVSKPNILLANQRLTAISATASASISISTPTPAFIALSPTASPHTPRAMTTDSSRGRQFTAADLNSNVVEAKYAVRGRLATRANDLTRQLIEKPGSLPFSEVIHLNIGNPQQLDQKPITFYREVLALLQAPKLLDLPLVTNSLKPDVVDRARRLLADIGSVGSYSHSQGVLGIRKSVAKFIERRDGFPADPNDIYLTAGASAAVNYLLSILSVGPQSGFLIPIPQYPLYTATLTLVNGTAVPYYLDESNHWSTDPAAIDDLVNDTIASGVTPKAIVVINPGNPTGACLSVKDIEEIIDVANDDGIVIIADEVYQENVFEGEFHSFKKVLRQLQQRYPGKYDGVQLASLHSVSKGMTGECGQRGGYMETVGFSEDFRTVLNKLVSISLCPVVTGQALVELMVDPPKPGDASYAEFTREYNGIFQAMKERATALYTAFQDMEGISCRKPQGAMYLFPRLDLPEKAIAVAKDVGEEPDEMYCMELLERTGICIIPGSGFGQVPGTYHFRTTFLAPGTEYIGRWEAFHKEFMDRYR